MLVTPMWGPAWVPCKYDGWLTPADIGEIFRQTRCDAQVISYWGTKYTAVQGYESGGQLRNAIVLAEQKIYENALLAVTLDTTGRTRYTTRRTLAKPGRKKVKGRRLDPVQQAAEAIDRLRKEIEHGPDGIFQVPPGAPPGLSPREGEELQTNNLTTTEGEELETYPEEASHPHTRGMKPIGVNVTGEDKPYPMPERGPASSSWDRPYPSYPGAVRYTPPSQGKSLATADRANDADDTKAKEVKFRPPPGLELQD